MSCTKVRITKTLPTELDSSPIFSRLKPYPNHHIYEHIQIETKSQQTQTLYFRLHSHKHVIYVNRIFP
jgi:hypothetical protein